MQDHIKGNPALKPFFLDDDQRQFVSGKAIESLVEICAMANLKKMQIYITEIDERWKAIEKKIFVCSNDDAEATLDFGDIFGCKKASHDLMTNTLRQCIYKMKRFNKHKFSNKI